MNRHIASPEDFQKLLDWLGPDQQQGIEKYEAIRRGLVELFDNWRCVDADDLAVETIDRVLSKVEKIAANYSGDPARYFYGTAKKVKYEYNRRPRPLPLTVDTPAEKTEEEIREKERLHACLDKCLNLLDPTDKKLIMDYYRGDKNVKIKSRKSLGEKAGVSSNALRVRVFRLRSTLEECISKCLERSEKR
jgi:RNA polymerase sigma factor (sigma-70 family)